MNLLNEFRTFLLSQKSQSSKATVKNYLADVNQFIAWFESEFKNKFSPGSVTIQIINLYKKSSMENLSAPSVERHLSSLRKFFNFLKLEGQIESNPLEIVNLESKIEEDPWHLKDFKNYLYVYDASRLTIKNYLIDVKQFIEWVEKVTNDNSGWEIKEKSNNFHRIDESLINEYKERLFTSSPAFSPATINRKLSSLRKYFSWAKEEGLIEARGGEVEGLLTARTRSERRENSGALAGGKPRQDPYSHFPPLRLAQKTKDGLFFVSDSIFIAPVIKITSALQYLAWNMRGKPIFFSQKHFPLRPKIKNLSKELYASYEISTKHFPIHKKIWYIITHKRPKWYKEYHLIPAVHYFHLAILIIFTSAIGFGFYQSFLEKPNSQARILAATPPQAPPQILSFQGKLTDANDNPITAATPIRFGIYDDPTATGSSAPKWQEINTVSPDANGLFSIYLGKRTTIPQSLFGEHSSLWLGITIKQTPELIPRQQLANVPYAGNAATLQGLLPITQSGAGTSNVVLALDSSGNLSIGGTATPTFQATGGKFTLSGTVLTLKTTAGCGAINPCNVEIAPDGTSFIDLQKPLQNTSNNNNVTNAVGAVEVDDMLAVLATSSAQSALTINQNSTGNLISASTSEIAKFTVDNSGNTTIAGNFLSALTASRDLGSSSVRWNNLWVQTLNATGTNTSGQASFTYDPADTTYAQATVLINPTSAGPNESLLGLGVGGLERARIDTEGDAAFGFAGGILTPNSNPLTLYNHGTTAIASVDTSGALTLSGAITAPTSTNTINSLVINAGALSGITSINMSGQFTSTLATGTAPFVIASTTNVANLNASSLNGATFAAPGAIGSGTPSTGAFTTLTSSGASTIGTGTSLTNTFGTGTTAANTIGVAGGTNAINGSTTILGTTLINSTDTSTTSIGNSTGVLVLASGGTSSWTNTSGDLTIQTATSGTTTIDSAGILNLGTVNSTATNLGKAATTLTINPTSWTATPTISGQITATLGLTSPSNILTTGSGTITSAGLLTASNGLTLSAGALNLTSTSGALNITGLGASTLTTASNNLTLGTVTSGTFALTSAGALNLSAASASTLTLASSSTTAFNIQSGLMDFDTTNSRVGIGTTAPTSTLDVMGTFHVGQATVPFSATGGTITTSGSYTIHTFTSSGTFTPNGAQNVEVLVVGGGGGGGTDSGGGGGAGGLTYNAAIAVTAAAIPVTVGNGGAAHVNGNNSVFRSITAIGGGAGSGQPYTPSTGGSGGGASGGSGTNTGAAGISGQGSAGGGSVSAAPSYPGGGGGGAGAVGGTPVNGSSNGGNGGVGLAYSISGSSIYYAGGGGAGGGAAPGSGGNGGGGAGGTPGVAGTDNTGGGGGGGGSTGGAGGSGIVIIRYLTASTTTANPINITAAGNIGIGTTSPGFLLDVNGDARIRAGFALYFQNVAANSNATLINAGISGQSQLELSTTGSANLTIGPTGNVGIGTSTPGSRLEVKGATADSTASGLNVTDSFGGSKLYVRNDGNVGIGTTSPGMKLHVQVTNNTDGIKLTGTQGYTVFDVIDAGTNDPGYLSLYYFGSKVAQIGTGATYFNTGNVGIGTITPSNTLQVIGSICAKSTDVACAANVAGTIYATNTTVQAADVAENYVSSENIEPGTLVVPGDTNTSVSKASLEYQESLIGIVSTNPGVTLNSDAKIDNLHSFILPIALNGRVPTKVTNENGEISTGDYLTSSATKPGFAMKATKAGRIVGVTLEDFVPDSCTANAGNFGLVDSSTCTGKIMTFINVGYYDPEPAIVKSANELKGFAIEKATGLANNTLEGAYIVKDELENVVTRSEVLASAVIGNLRAGAIDAKDIVAEQITSYKLLVTSEIVSPLASVGTLNVDTITPASSNKIVIKLEDKSATPSAETPKLEIQNASGSAVASIDSAGNATFSGQLSSNGIDTKEASVTGTLRAKNIIADNIDTQILNLKSQISDLINPQASPSARPVDIASFSAQLAFVDTLQATTGTFTQGLFAIGPSSFSDASIFGQLSVGGNLTIADNSINVLGGDLNFQSLGQGGVSFFAGKVYIDSDGNISSSGNATFKGTLFANIISPIPGGDLILNLYDKNSSESAKFVVKNASGSAVLSISSNGDLNSQGLGTFKKLGLGGLVSPALALSEKEILATGSAGVATISAQEKELTVNNDLVTDKSLIYITPVGTPSGQIPFLSRQEQDKSFTVGLENLTLQPLQFNWLIIN